MTTLSPFPSYFPPPFCSPCFFTPLFFTFFSPHPALLAATCVHCVSAVNIKLFNYWIWIGPPHSGAAFGGHEHKNVSSSKGYGGSKEGASLNSGNCGWDRWRGDHTSYAEFQTWACTEGREAGGISLIVRGKKHWRVK